MLYPNVEELVNGLRSGPSRVAPLLIGSFPAALLACRSGHLANLLLGQRLLTFLSRLASLARQSAYIWRVVIVVSLRRYCQRIPPRPINQRQYR